MTLPISERPQTGRLPRTARRAQLLGVARSVFAEQGYHGASMDDIAEGAGVSKPVLYQHFGGKLDLYLALLEAAADEVIAGVRTALESTSANSKRVQATMALWYDYATDQTQAFRLIFESDLTNLPEVKSIVDKVHAESAVAVADIIEQETDLSPAAAHLLAATLVGMGHSGARSWLAGGSELSRDEAIQLAATLAWRGIGGFPTHTHQEEK